MVVETIVEAGETVIKPIKCEDKDLLSNFSQVCSASLSGPPHAARTLRATRWRWLLRPPTISYCHKS